MSIRNYLLKRVHLLFLNRDTSLHSKTKPFNHSQRKSYAKVPNQIASTPISFQVKGNCHCSKPNIATISADQGLSQSKEISSTYLEINPVADQLHAIKPFIYHH
ncbi:hypothetical protein DSO57_1007594 [Entomophthora muscae]|uniref:Uncharacterized protein n=1 Tax=Entomophthora muscae TaxID=34485 RepID=A0ACC2RYL3_9FUNG|nr:hypothetical protein DSO57_1007594 [Entomophthora muscae]